MQRLAAFAAALSLLAAPCVLAAGVRGEPPRRVVSLNPCLDAILMEVAEPDQIAALSRYSADPAEFALAERARGFRHIRGEAEEIAALHPDLVLMSGMGDLQLETVLPRLKIASARFQVPDSVAQSLEQVRRVAALAGHPERGEALAARIQAALREAAPAPGEPRLSALVFEDRGQVSGSGTLMDELMRRTGFDNVAPRYGARETLDLPLERVLADPPQVLLSGQLQPGEPSWADRVLSHPALASLRGRMRRESFPQPLLFCGGPVIIPAVQALAKARRDADGWR